MLVWLHVVVGRSSCFSQQNLIEVAFRGATRCLHTDSPLAGLVGPYVLRLIKSFGITDSTCLPVISSGGTAHGIRNLALANRASK